LLRPRAWNLLFPVLDTRRTMLLNTPFKRAYTRARALLFH
jgi:hypothetical protein